MAASRVKLVNAVMASLMVVGSGREEVSEVRKWNWDQLALSKIQRGGSSILRGGEELEERIIGKWSLSHRSGWVAQDKEGASWGEQKVRSIAESEPEVELRWVGVPGELRRWRFGFDERAWSMMLPRALVRRGILEGMPQVGLWALKSPQMMKGEGNALKRGQRSSELVLWEGDVHRAEGNREGVEFRDVYFYSNVLKVRRRRKELG